MAHGGERGLSSRLLVAGAALAAGTVQAAPLLTFVPRLKPWWPGLNGQGRQGHVALTFDDGPDAWSTPRFLDLLAALDVRATFFVLGEMAQRHPDLAGRILAEGHEVAVHSWDHRNHLRHLPGRATSEQLSRTTDLLEAQTGVRPRFWRPPYGALTTAGVAAARTLDLQTVLWTAWGRDWRREATAASVLADVTAGGLDGGTVLLHDSDCTSEPGAWRSTYAALPALVGWCRDRGLVVGPVGDHGLAA